MEDNHEETVLLNSILPNTQRDDQIGKYFYVKSKIKTINRSDNIGFHVVSRYQYNQVLQLLIPNNAPQSFQNILSQLTLNDQSNIEQIERFFLSNSSFE